MTSSNETSARVGAGFAERLLEIIDSGRRTATYKLAVLLALLDLCVRRSDEEGRPPGVVYTRHIAEEVAGLYWPQVIPFPLPDSDAAIPLRQITGPRAAIVDAVRRFRHTAEAQGCTSLYLARQHFADDFAAMVDLIERTVAEQPLPRLQAVGSRESIFPFIYDLDWGPRERFTVRRLREHGSLGPAIHLRPGAGDELVRLAPLIRPLVELHWTRMVAHINGVARTEEDLHRHLFGSDRVVPPRTLREGLAELQAGGCFYCDGRLAGRLEADHFIPRVRCGIDAIENLVLAHPKCNNDKRDLLAAPRFVTLWANRNHDHSAVLADLARRCGWHTDADGTIAVARSIYRHLPQIGTPFWLGLHEVGTADPATALTSLQVSSTGRT